MKPFAPVTKMRTRQLRYPRTSTREVTKPFGPAFSHSGAARSARLQRGAAIQVGQGAAQAEVFEDQRLFRLSEAALGPTIAAQKRNADFHAILLDHQHAT